MVALPQDALGAERLLPLFRAARAWQRTGPHERLTRICFIDYDREMALVAERAESEARSEIIAIGRLIKTHGIDEAEFAIIVADAWQGRGLGSALLKLLVEVARAENLRRVTGRILADNTTMMEVSRRIGFTLQPRPDEGKWEAEIKLPRKHNKR